MENDKELDGKIESIQRLDTTEKTIVITESMYRKLKAFTGLTNNYLMGMSVSGDDIHSSSELMKLALELFEGLEEIGNG